MTTIEDDYDEEQSAAEFVDTLMEQFVPRLTNRIELLNLGGGSISEVMNRQREQFEELELLCAGLPPRYKGEMVERLAPRWSELTALINENRRAALRMLAKRSAAHG